MSTPLLAMPRSAIVGYSVVHPEKLMCCLLRLHFLGALAQRSGRTKMDQNAARAQVELCRHLTGLPSKDRSDRFALLDMVRILEDYVVSHSSSLFVELAESKRPRDFSGPRLYPSEAEFWSLCAVSYMDGVERDHTSQKISGAITYD